METLCKDRIRKIKKNIYKQNYSDIQKYNCKGTLTYEQFVIKIKEQGNKCYVCLQEFQYNGGRWCYFSPSADRIYNDSPHTKENIAVSCLFCNIRMFKQISEKRCGLCEGLHHIYTGDIITKSTLFYTLGNDDYKIKQYIESLHKVKEPVHDFKKIEPAAEAEAKSHVDPSLDSYGFLRGGVPVYPDVP